MWAGAKISPGWTSIAFTALAVLGLGLALILALGNRLNPVTDAALNVVIMGALSVVYVIRGIQCARSDAQNKTVQIGFSFLLAICLIANTAINIVKLVST